MENKLWKVNIVDERKWKKQSEGTMARSLDTHSYSAAVSIQALSSISQNKCRAIWTRQWLFSWVTVLASARACEVEHSQRSWWISWSQNQKQTSLNDGIPLGGGGGGVVKSASMMEIWKYFSVIFNCFSLSHQEQMLFVFWYIVLNTEWVLLNFTDNILFEDQNVKWLSIFFSLLQYMNLGLTLVTVGVKDMIMGQIQW